MFVLVPVMAIMLLAYNSLSYKDSSASSYFFYNLALIVQVRVMAF